MEGRSPPCLPAVHLVYASESLQLHLFPEQALLRLRWRLGVTTEGFHQGLIAAVSVTQAQRLRNWVTLNHHVYPLGPAEQLWLQEHALLPLDRGSLRQVAIVLPAAAFRVSAHESLVASSRALVSYQIDYFPTLHLAASGCCSASLAGRLRRENSPALTRWRGIR